jgi:signal transduction histidine kinase
MEEFLWKVNLFSLFGLINAITSLVLGSFVYFSNRKILANKLFGLMSFSIFVWSFFYFLWLKNIDGELVLMLLRGFSLGATLIPVFYLHWVFALLGIEKKRKNVIRVVYFLGFSFLGLNFSPFFIQDFRQILYFPFWPIPGLAYHLWLIFFFVCVLMGLFCLIRNYSIAEGYKRQQILYVLFGSVVGFGGGATNFFLWYNIPIPPFLNFLVSFYTLILAYAVLKYRLMDIRIVIRSSAIFLANLIITSILILSLLFLFDGFFNLNYNYQHLALFLSLLVLAILIFTILDDYLRKTISKKLFTVLYNEERIIRNLIKDLPRALDIEQLSDIVINTLQNVFRIKLIAFCSINVKEGKFDILRKIGCHKDCDISFLIKNRIFLKYIIDYYGPIILEELSSVIDEMSEENSKKVFLNIKVEMEKKGIKIIIPLVVKDRLVGLLFLGGKINNLAYSKRDVNLLNIISNQLSVSLENSRLYSETQKFNDKMRAEVRTATMRLRNNNKQLRNLDRAKSEFISIASHQLRTPLAAIKGYSSMLLEGDYGNISKKAGEPIDRIFSSSERMSSLIENLLNISRIESGKIVFNFQKVNLIEMSQRLVKEFYPVTKIKGLKLKLNYQKNIPKVSVDEIKIKEVMSNMIDNAIKYTSKGCITINLKTVKEKNKKFLVFSVVDTGLGIDKGELPTIFKKFSRGKKVFLIHTEGVGLGLYFSYKVVVAHKGKIWVESPGEGKGSTFVFKIPI